MENIAQKIDIFLKNQGANSEAYRHFASLAAVPLLLSPDLLYKLWRNFKTYKNSDGKLITIPHFAVSDMLLSNFCRPVGFQLFKLEENVRKALLNELDLKQKQEVATFIQQYAQKHFNASEKNIQQIHLKLAKSYLNPSGLVEEIKDFLLDAKKSSYEKNQELHLYFQLEGSESADSALGLVLREAMEGTVDSMEIERRFLRGKLGERIKQANVGKGRKFMTDFPVISQKYFFKKEDLISIKETFKTSFCAAIIGEVGIGKTTLACSYMLRYQDDYSRIVYLNSLNNSLGQISSIFLQLGVNIEDINILKVITEAEYLGFKNSTNILHKIVNQINDIKGHKLLVIDDIDVIKIPKFLFRYFDKLRDFHFLIVGRFIPKSFPKQYHIIDLGKILIENPQHLFYQQWLDYLLYNPNSSKKKEIEDYLLNNEEFINVCFNNQEFEVILSSQDIKNMPLRIKNIELSVFENNTISFNGICYFEILNEFFLNFFALTYKFDLKKIKDNWCFINPSINKISPRDALSTFYPYIKEYKEGKPQQILELEKELNITLEVTNQILENSYNFYIYDELYDSISHLYINNANIKNTSLLSKFKHLEYLNLDNNFISNLSFLSEFKELKHLSLNNNQIENISALWDCTNLEYLSLENNRINEIHHIRFLDKLKSLNLKGNQIKEVTSDFLKHLTELERLNLQLNPISNIPKEIYEAKSNTIIEVREYLKEERRQFVENLKYDNGFQIQVNLKYHNLVIINEIKGKRTIIYNGDLVYVYTIFVTDLAIEESEYISEKIDLIIDFYEKHFGIAVHVDIEPKYRYLIENSDKNLLNQFQQWLDLTNRKNHIVFLKIASLSDKLNFELKETNDESKIIAPNLRESGFYICNESGQVTHLNLLGFELRDLSFLEDFKDLEVLNLNGNRISKIEEIAGLTKLRKLDLGNNRIIYIQPLSELFELEELYLGNNQIISSSFLINLKKLRIIELQFNELERFYLKRNIEDPKITNHFSGFDKLDILRLFNNPICEMKPEVFEQENCIKALEEYERSNDWLVDLYIYEVDYSYEFVSEQLEKIFIKNSEYNKIIKSKNREQLKWFIEKERQFIIYSQVVTADVKIELNTGEYIITKPKFISNEEKEFGIESQYSITINPKGEEIYFYEYPMGIAYRMLLDSNLNDSLITDKSYIFQQFQNFLDYEYADSILRVYPKYLDFLLSEDGNTHRGRIKNYLFHDSKSIIENLDIKLLSSLTNNIKEEFIIGHIELTTLDELILLKDENSIISSGKGIATVNTMEDNFAYSLPFTFDVRFSKVKEEWKINTNIKDIDYSNYNYHIKILLKGLPPIALDLNENHEYIKNDKYENQYFGFFNIPELGENVVIKLYFYEGKNEANNVEIEGDYKNIIQNSKLDLLHQFDVYLSKFKRVTFTDLSIKVLENNIKYDNGIQIKVENQENLIYLDLSFVKKDEFKGNEYAGQIKLDNNETIDFTFFELPNGNANEVFINAKKNFIYNSKENLLLQFQEWLYQNNQSYKFNTSKAIDLISRERWNEALSLTATFVNQRKDKDLEKKLASLQKELNDIRHKQSIGIVTLNELNLLRSRFNDKLIKFVLELENYTIPLQLHFTTAQSHKYLGNNNWDWSVWIESSEMELDLIELVAYHLHSSFKNPIKTIKNRKTKFLLKSEGWGMFTIKIDIQLKNGKKVELSHYLELDYPQFDADVAKNLLAQNNIDAVFVMVNDYLSQIDNQEIYTSMITLQARYNQLKQEELKRVLYKEEADIEKIQLRTRLLALIDSISRNTNTIFQESLDNQTILKTKIVSFNSGGFMIEYLGKNAFLPISQVVDKEILNPNSIGQELEIIVSSFDKKRNNFIVSNILAVEQRKLEQKKTTFESLKIGQIIEGEVISFEKIGAFIKLTDNINGLLHISEISWKAVNQLQDGLTLNQRIKVKIIDLDKDKFQVSLSLKALEEKPNLAGLYKIGDIVEGTIIKSTEDRLDIKLSDNTIAAVIGKENILKKKEIPRNQKNKYKNGDTIKAKIIGFDNEKVIINLSISQYFSDIFHEYIANLSVGDEIEGIIERFVNSGLVVKLVPDLTAYLAAADFSWYRKYTNPEDFAKVGDKIKVKILEFDNKLEIIRIGHKQLERGPWTSNFKKKYKIGVIFKGEVLRKDSRGYYISTPDKVEAFMPLNLKKDVAIGEQYLFEVTEFDASKNMIKVELSRDASSFTIEDSAE